jgi:hypothetical protein
MAFLTRSCLPQWVSSLAYPNLLGTKGVVDVLAVTKKYHKCEAWTNQLKHKNTQFGKPWCNCIFCIFLKWLLLTPKYWSSSCSHQRMLGTTLGKEKWWEHWDCRVQDNETSNWFHDFSPLTTRPTYATMNNKKYTEYKWKKNNYYNRLQNTPLSHREFGVLILQN